MKVLVVEAEDTSLKLLGVMLKQLGYKVELAVNCSDALKAYEDGPQDIVLIAMKFFRGSSAGGTALVMPCSRRTLNSTTPF